MKSVVKETMSRPRLELAALAVALTINLTFEEVAQVELLRQKIAELVHRDGVGSIPVLPKKRFVILGSSTAPVRLPANLDEDAKKIDLKFDDIATIGAVARRQPVAKMRGEAVDVCREVSQRLNPPQTYAVL